MVSNFVRLAIALDTKKLPISKKDIATYILAGKPKKRGLLQDIVAKGKEKLKSVFGFELVEYVKMEENTVTKTISKKTKSKASSNTFWLLRLEKSGDTDQTEKKCKELLQDEKKGEVGFLMIVLSLIIIHRPAIPEEILYSFLKKLDFEKGKFHPDIGLPEKLLEKFVKENYLVKADKINNTEEGKKATYSYKIGKRIYHEVERLDSILGWISQITGSPIDKALLKELQGSTQLTEGEQIMETVE